MSTATGFCHILDPGAVPELLNEGWGGVATTLNVLSISKKLQIMFYSYEDFFALTVMDLQEKIARGTEYDFIRGCGLCRHLLLDASTPLWDLANREHKLKLAFEVCDYTDFHNGLIRFETGWMTIMPNHLHPKTKMVNLKSFLKIILINNNQYSYTVKDIIRAASHYLGGIHNGKPEDEEQESLHDFHMRTSEHVKLLFFAAKAICTVIAKAMEPLLEKTKTNILAKNRFEY